jgi:hypothetical protein
MFDHILFGLVFAQQALATSQIALFSDSNCQDSLRGLEGPNGYPNGTCTDLRRNGPYGSLQVVGLDPGCTGARQLYEQHPRPSTDSGST